MSKQTVLILEDDPNWQAILTELIQDLNYKPVVVDTLPRAQDALSDSLYALAIVDISLSMTDHGNRGGLEALKRINQLNQRLPTVVVTGHGTLDLAIETLAELEAVHFFKKEAFDRRKFRDVVREHALADDGLSEREREVLALMSQGYTNREIAATLIVSVNTVKKHVQSIFTKFNVNTRAAAVAKAAERI